MRYFKCESQVNNDDIKAKHGAILRRGDTERRWHKVLNVLGWIVFAAIFLTAMLIAGWISSSFLMHIKSWYAGTNLFVTILLGLLDSAGVFVMLVIALVVGLCAAVAASAPFFGSTRALDKQKRQALLAESCQHLRAFYGLQEPYIVTKCYDSSDQRFKNHDICLFLTDGELRLTANLTSGFLDMSRDLGCYAFVPGEIELSACRAGDRPAVEIRCGEVAFLLGQRAKSFVEQILVS